MTATTLPEGAELSTSTSVTTQTGVKWSKTLSGKLRGRDLYAETKYVINAVFAVVDEDAAEELESFLVNYRTALLSVVIRQYTYEVYVTGDVTRTYLGGDGLVSLSVPMEGVRV